MKTDVMYMAAMILQGMLDSDCIPSQGMVTDAVTAAGEIFEQVEKMAEKRFNSTVTAVNIKK